MRSLTKSTVLLTFVLAIIATTAVRANVVNPLANLEDQLLEAEQLFSWVITPQLDSDEDTLLNIDGLPKDAILLNNRDGSSTLVWMPNKADVGEHKIVIHLANFNSPDVTTERAVRLNVATHEDYKVLRAEQLTAKSVAAAVAFQKKHQQAVTVVTSSTNENDQSPIKQPTASTAAGDYIDKLFSQATTTPIDTTDTTPSSLITGSDLKAEPAAIADTDGDLTADAVSAVDTEEAAPETQLQSSDAPTTAQKSDTDLPSATGQETHNTQEQITETDDAELPIVAEANTVNEPERAVIDNIEDVDDLAVARYLAEENKADDDLDAFVTNNLAAGGAQETTDSEPSASAEPLTEETNTADNVEPAEGETTLVAELDTSSAESTPDTEVASVEPPSDSIDAETLAEEIALAAEAETPEEINIDASTDAAAIPVDTSDSETPNLDTELVAETDNAAIVEAEPDLDTPGDAATQTEPLAVVTNTDEAEQPLNDEPELLDQDLIDRDFTSLNTESDVVAESAEEELLPEVEFELDGEFKLQALQTFKQSIAFSTDSEAALTLKALNVPTGATLVETSPRSYQFSWTPELDEIGEQTLIFQVRDENQSAVIARRVKLVIQ